MPAQLAGHQQQPQRQSEQLTADRCQGDTRDLEIQADHKHQIQRHVSEVGGQHHGQRRAGVLHAQEPTDQGEVGQGGGRAPQADVQVIARERFNVCIRCHDPQRDGRGRHSNQPQENAQTDSHQQGARQHRPQTIGVLASEMLGGDSRRAHAEKIQAHEQQTDDARADGNCAQILRSFQMTHHRRVHDAQRRDADVGDNHGQSDTPDRSIGGAAEGGGHEPRA